MADLILDCTTQDIERLSDRLMAVSATIQQVQLELTKDLDARDKMIVINASVAQLRKCAEAACRKSATPRFLRSIRNSLTIARAFGSGKPRRQPL
jgi:hypothetical protein